MDFPVVVGLSLWIDGEPRIQKLSGQVFDVVSKTVSGWTRNYSTPIPRFSSYYEDAIPR